MWRNLLFLLFGAVLCAGVEHYEGYKVYETVPQNASHADLLWQLSQISEEFDFWSLSKLPNMPAKVMVPPKLQEDFEAILTENGLGYSIINHDVSETIRREHLENLFAQPLTPSIGFSKFYRHAQINAYLDELEEKYPERVHVSVVGESFEKRTLKTITISNGDGRTDKKVIFVDAGIHAREWIAPATALYIIHQLVENFDQNEYLLKNIDWIILPVVNPDGYEYTHTNSRLWRKTRKPNSRCIGTDGNRNFGFHWGESGASNNECDETFQGSTAFSEPETKIVRDIQHRLSDRCKFYLTLHSYGNYLLYPWGFTSELPDNWRDLDEVAMAGFSAIKSFSGKKYSVGSSTNVLYASAGGSDDYAMGAANIPVAITMELPGGGSGFDPSPSQIKPMVTESWEGIRAMAQKIDEKDGLQRPLFNSEKCSNKSTST